MAGPRYQHLVWNRTDLTVSQSNLGASYLNSRPPLVSEKFPPANYAGEVIPAYAVMRVLTNPIWYKEEICYTVCRPDDISMSDQPVGLHFFNGRTPIPVGGFTRATNDLPAPVLVDLSIDSGSIPYGNLGVTSGSQSAADLGTLVGYASGSWALVGAADIVSYGSQGLFQTASAVVPGGTATMLATVMPYVVIGRHPVGLSGKALDMKKSPDLAFQYSNQIFWVGTGTLGFGSVTSS